MPEEYEDWFDAQIYSGKASEMFANFKDVIFPLEKTRKQAVLDTMWKNINLVCIMRECHIRRRLIAFPELSNCLR